jgi:Bacterial sugar transferase
MAPFYLVPNPRNTHLVAIVLLIRVSSPGPAFYGHRRIGTEGKPFRCWKFRTMYPQAERLLNEYLRSNPHLRAEWEQNQKLRDDPRDTRRTATGPLVGSPTGTATAVLRAATGPGGRPL